MLSASPLRSAVVMREQLYTCIRGIERVNRKGISRNANFELREIRILAGRTADRPDRGAMGLGYRSGFMGQEWRSPEGRACGV